MNLVGALGRRLRAEVDERGGITLEDSRWTLDWWVGGDDRWRFPAEEPAVRQSLLEAMPVVRTALRIPEGDAIHTVYGVADGSFVVDVANESPAAFALVLVVSGARSLDVEGTSVLVDGEPAFTTARAPRGWAVATDGALRDIVTAGDARSDVFAGVSDRRRRLEAAFLYPVPHRTSLRVTLGASRQDGPVPTPDDVAKGWITQLDRGMRVTLPDESLQERVVGARAQAVLQAGRESDDALLANLEDWGLDDEAALAWERASVMDRRRARRRGRGGITRGGVLGETRELLVRETGKTSNGRSVVEILTTLPQSWLGGNVDVRDAPLREGLLSYTVRWHGEHPALLWEMPDGVELRAPGLDPSWSTTEPSGEALVPLATVPST